MIKSLRWAERIDRWPAIGAVVVIAGMAWVLSAAVIGDLGSTTLVVGPAATAAAVVTILRTTSGRPQNSKPATAVWVVLAILAVMSVAAFGAGIALAAPSGK